MGGIDKRLGRVNTTKSFDDEGEVDEADKHHVEFLESRENTSKSLQAPEQSLDLVASLVTSHDRIPTH